MRPDRLPYALPAPGEPTRVAFVGDPAAFGPHVLGAPAGGLIPTLVAPGDHDALRAADPHVVVALAPESFAPGALDAVAAPVLGVVAAPLQGPEHDPHPVYAANLEALRVLAPDSVDRVVLTDALSWESAATLGLPLWRAMPLPVDDRLYRAPRRTARPPRVVALGAATAHRDEVLDGLRREFALSRHAGPPGAEDLRAALDAADVALNVHAERWVMAFEPTLLVHLAAGHLVVTELLETLYGLEPGLDLLVVSDHYEMDLRVHQLFKTPEMYDRVRLRGHHKSRQFKASIIWPRVIGDLLADLAAFGTDRQRPATA
ncbi:MAG TPA: hypothetical protein VFG42_22075 [Baekduia sp.]|uniref:hypothetical protein n=1 Tax=Baekduia sp. TaxID=2600305 RepID=UPI002D7655D3|nr:hypothetical protein [Baekduia sp.]HET6509502.1 hypothetical protein [Baekduia sp.]